MAAASKSGASSLGCLSYLINHIFLPPQLPQEDDSDPSSDRALLESIVAGLDAFESTVPAHDKHKVRRVTDSLMLMKNSMAEGGHVDSEKLREAFGRLANSANGIQPLPRGPTATGRRLDTDPRVCAQEQCSPCI